ncbi:hypothetical protein [Thalassotalea piscium]|uniref:Uncharacterized protein n=1 Tax=Thalassotalea piscium TaxID=1230533 RepID=A0A7X0NKA7_9GAMM|nr:hypothetical protein [Thalassotalea piscium]MBB6544975.1 hypothetical protein [Thalassotalea piscium]
MIKSDIPKPAMTRYIQLDDWIFEVKAVRALRVKDYGQPYSAIVNINVNGDSAYIDGLMSREQEQFSRNDYNTVVEFCRKLSLNTVSFDRFKNGALVSEIIDLKKQSTAMLFKLAN